MDRDKILFLAELENELRRLELQKMRTLKPEEGVSPVHDADLYMVLARRLYRDIEKAARADSRVANLKGQYKTLLEKIKMRDHFEHGFDVETLPSADGIQPDILKGTIAGAIANVKIATSVFNINGKVNIVSGDSNWDLDADHSALVEVVGKFASLYPFKNDPS